jgi:hypothetical protein
VLVHAGRYVELSGPVLRAASGADGRGGGERSGTWDWAAQTGQGKGLYRSGQRLLDGKYCTFAIRSYLRKYFGSCRLSFPQVEHEKVLVSLVKEVVRKFPHM